MSEDDRVQENPKQEEEDIEEGYQTPTSEEHKIPKVDLSRPPPAPRRKRPVNGAVTEDNIVILSRAQLESLFRSLARIQSNPFTSNNKRTDHN